MNNIIAVWAFFNGRKTAIAGIVLTIGAFLSQVVGDLWGFQPEWMLKTIKTLEWIGMMLGGTGIGHKVGKMIKPESTSQFINPQKKTEP